MAFTSPAKINLFLRVLEKRRDGYHNIASLFHLIDLTDKITITLSNQDHFYCNNPTIMSPSNLVWKAVNLFRFKTGLKFKVSIELEKNIPLQSGLGGGSSNAATTLKGLNQLFHGYVNHEELQRWSLEIGSDVPFFFSRTGSAYCTGRGEIVRDIPRIDQKFRVYIPKRGLSTPAVYQALDLSDCHQEDPEKLLEGFLNQQPLYINDLEKPAFKMRPNLALIKEKLNGTMSGSGTAFFYKIPNGSNLLI
ncbi:MAG: 4-(cytidine 5'-diphospho)-2-C-methyl-D-erythritol kinase [Chlamydiales bacterium]